MLKRIGSAEVLVLLTITTFPASPADTLPAEYTDAEFWQLQLTASSQDLCEAILRSIRLNFGLTNSRWLATLTTDASTYAPA